jgi:hypothetical protein
MGRVTFQSEILHCLKAENDISVIITTGFMYASRDPSSICFVRIKQVVYTIDSGDVKPAIVKTYPPPPAHAGRCWNPHR